MKLAQICFQITVALVLLFSSSITARANSHTNIQTVFMILMENASWPDVVGGTNAPYITKTLLPQSSYASNMFTIGAFGSLPQYLWLESGTNWGINDSSDPASHQVHSTNHFVLQLEAAGISWRAYEDSISGTTCPTASSGLYAAFHNPFVYFDDIYTNASRCTNYIRPYTELARDLTNNTVARYNFITPNLCNDMHGGTGCAAGVNRILLGDIWLSSEVPRIMASPAYTNNGAIIITWDEGTANVPGPFGTIVLSPLAKGGGYRMTNHLDHTATFRTLQEIFKVPFLYSAKNATGLGDLFKPIIQLTSPLLTTDQTLQFTAEGVAPGKTNFIQFTTNLTANPVVWTNLFTTSATTNRLTFIDTNASNSPKRFYRLLESY
jgi:hypothetical protein